MEKMTRIKCQAAYMQKVQKTSFSNSTVIDDLQSQVEAMFGASFEKGSRKKAIQRLRFMGASPNHHFASWRAGVLLGLAIPAFIDGIVKSFQPAVRDRIPGYPSCKLHVVWPIAVADTTSPYSTAALRGYGLAVSPSLGHRHCERRERNSRT
jgi:hypothetical protein